MCVCVCVLYGCALYVCIHVHLCVHVYVEETGNQQILAVFVYHLHFIYLQKQGCPLSLEPISSITLPTQLAPEIPKLQDECREYGWATATCLAYTWVLKTQTSTLTLE